MKTRIRQFGNINNGNYEKYYIEIKSKRDGKYHILMNGSSPHCFESHAEAENYLQSVKKVLEDLVENEPIKIRRKRITKIL